MDDAKIIALDTTEQLLVKADIDSRIEFTARTNLANDALSKLPGVVSLEANDGSYRAVTTDARPRWTYF